MNSFDFLRKLYRTSRSAVIISNSANTIYWSTNLSKLGITDEDIKSRKVVEMFGRYPYQLSPGEYIANIKGNSFTYNVKTYADRTNEFVILEIRTDCLNKEVINDEQISSFIQKTNFDIQKNTADIMSIVDKMQSNRYIPDEEDYNSIVNSAKNLLNSNRSVNDVIEIRNDIKKNQLENISLSSLLSKFAENCEIVFSPKNVEVSMNCVEDIYSSMGINAFNNLCLSVLNRLLCISDGYLDKITMGLEMVTQNHVELSFASESQSGKSRISNLDELKERLNKNDAIGTDLFAIKYFCEKFHAEATQRINHEDHSTVITVKLPNCTSQGIMLFSCDESAPKKLDRFSKINIALGDIVSSIK